MPALPNEFDDVVVCTNDGFRRQLRYKADAATAWTNVDLTAATEIHVYLLTSAGVVAKTFLAKTTHVALFTLTSAGYIEFQAALTTFVAADAGSYLLRLRVVNSSWPDGKTFSSPAGVRIIL